MYLQNLLNSFQNLSVSLHVGVGFFCVADCKATAAESGLKIINVDAEVLVLQY